MNLMFNFIGNWLNKITMYRLLIYGTGFLWLLALFFSIFHILPYAPLDFILSGIFILAVCYFVNYIFAWAYGAPSNLESVYITALILALIITPSQPINNLAFFAWVALWAMATKYILAIGKKHIFNPAAFAVALTSLTISQSATWWIGNLVMAPFVALVGFLIVQKIRRFDLVISFLVFALGSILFFGWFKGVSSWQTLGRALFYSPVLFFVGVMLTEPMTTPSTRARRISYGALVGILFNPAMHFGSFYLTPELALVMGNIYSYLISPKQKLILKLKEKLEIGANTYDFIFRNQQKFAFAPGQYLEWTFNHVHPDNRGIRRFFTIASAPTENDLRLGLKFYPASSSYKRELFSADQGTTVVASQLAGDFTLPKNKKQKLVFVAGGIGITPFRSMIKYLIDIREKRDIVLFYCTKTMAEICYTDVFDDAEKQFGLKTIYTLTDKNIVPSDWQGNIGTFDEATIAREVPDYQTRIFYLSGPHGMVVAFKNTLEKMGVKKRQIKTDYFPGFA